MFWVDDLGAGWRPKKKAQAPKFEDDGRPGEAELLRALGNPLRIKILALTAERVMSPNAMARKIGDTVVDVGYRTPGSFAPPA